MKRAMRYAMLALVWLLLTEAFCQTDSSSDTFALEPGEHSVGFRLIEAQDHSRVVSGGLPGRTHPRPIRAYVWYPAEPADGARFMRFGDYWSLAKDDIWPAEIAGPLRDALEFSRRPLPRSLEAEAFETLSRRRMLAVESADAAVGSFPLIAFGQGLYYEFPVALAALAEFLAGRGFVVATVPLLGTDSPIVKVDVQDLETQVRDLEFVIAEVRRQLPFVTSNRLGVLGFDLGGMAAVVLAMRNREVDALVTLDSGVLYPHPSGIPAASPHYDPFALRAPWLHATSTPRAAPPAGFSEADSLFSQALHSERYLLLSDSTEHADYTSYALIENRDTVLGYWDAGTAEGAAAHRSMAEYVHRFLSAYLVGSSESLAALSRPLEGRADADITIEHRAGVSPSIRYEEFVLALLGGRADEAIDAVRSLRDREPTHVLLDDGYLMRITYSLLFSWGLAEEAAVLGELMVELYPEAVDAKAILGEAYIGAGNYPAAIETYGSLLEQVPDDARTQARLEWLRSREAE